MDSEKNKIPSPFKAPDGYFDSFEQRLNTRISSGESKMKVTSNRSIMDYVAVAATIAAVLVTGWFVLFRTQPAQVETMAVSEPDSAVAPRDTVVAIMKDSLPTGDLLAADLVAELEQTTKTAAFTQTSLSKSDMAVASELEDAGLIVMDINDGIFDEFEL